MPRRPRPSRVPSHKTQKASNKISPLPPLKSTKPAKFQSRAESSSNEEKGYESNDASALDHGSDVGDDDNEDDEEDVEEDEEEEDDVDAPRVAQWVDEEDLEGENWDESNDPGPSELKTLQDDWSGLPLGALRKAQQVLTHAIAEPEDSDNSEDDSEDGPDVLNSKGKEKAKPEWSTKRRTDIAKRSSKHAPMEVTSKKPVTRKRAVIEVQTLQPRDPRFLPLAGEFSAEKFQKSYGFLAETHKTELRTLRENLKRARKLLASSPHDLYDERESEVNRLELAVKRAESLVNKDRRDKVEQEALSKLTKEEREKRKDGKGEWYLKNSNKRELLIRARYEALAADGGKRAVKKAIEKKQKKIGQKEKKSRPYPKGGLKRGFDSSSREDGREKRRRVG